jgi:hypothetical protein
MSENLNERGSITSDIGEVEIATDDLEFEDQRLRFFLAYLNMVYGTTPTSFKKGLFLFVFYKLFSLFSAILNNDTNRKLIESFLDKSDRNIILIFENSDPINLLNEFPMQIKSKIICFVKRNEHIIDKHIPIQNQLTVAEFTQSSLTQLALFISQVDYSFQSSFAFFFS